MFHIIVSYNYYIISLYNSCIVYGMYIAYMYLYMHNGISDDIYVQYYEHDTLDRL